ncbi:MAG: hypothetical protein WC551_06075 [Patescibacteria group bacterium]
MGKFFEKLVWALCLVFFVGVTAGGCVMCWDGNLQPFRLSDYVYSAYGFDDSSFGAAFLVNTTGFLESWLGFVLFCLGIILIAGMFTKEKMNDPKYRLRDDREQLKMILGGVATLIASTGLAVLAWQRECHLGWGAHMPQGDFMGLLLVMVGLFLGIPAVFCAVGVLAMAFDGYEEIPDVEPGKTVQRIQGQC